MDTTNRPLGSSSDERTDEQLRLPADLAAVDQALGTLPPQRPSATAVDAVIALATHSGIRKLYNEDAPAATSTHTEKEIALLSPIASALDQLPAQKPDPGVIDALIGAAMHSGVRELYHEEQIDEISERESVEVARLAPLVAALDRLPQQRPDRARLAAIMAKAGGSARADRPLIRSNRRMPVWAGAIAAVLLIGFSTFWVITSTTFTEEPVQIAQVEDATAAPQPVIETEEPAAAPPVDESPFAVVEPAAASNSARNEAPVTRSRPPTRPVQTAAVTQEEPIEESRMEESEEALRAVYLRLDAMQYDGLAWDDAEFELGEDTPPPVNTTNHGWMQVRVDR